MPSYSQDTPFLKVLGGQDTKQIFSEVKQNKAHIFVKLWEIFLIKWFGLLVSKTTIFVWVPTVCEAYKGADKIKKPLSFS